MRHTAILLIFWSTMLISCVHARKTTSHQKSQNVDVAAMDAIEPKQEHASNPPDTIIILGSDCPSERNYVSDPWKVSISRVVDSLSIVPAGAQKNTYVYNNKLIVSLEYNGAPVLTENTFNISSFSEYLKYYDDADLLIVTSGFVRSNTEEELVMLIGCFHYDTDVGYDFSVHFTPDGRYYYYAEMDDIDEEFIAFPVDTIRYSDKNISLSKEGWSLIVQQRADSTGVMQEKYDGNRFIHYFTLDSSITVNIVKDGQLVVSNEIISKETLWELYKYTHPILKELQICNVDILEVSGESVAIIVSCANYRGEVICQLPVSFP